MHRGYTCLWRKIWSNRVLDEPRKRFSRLEAWLYITNVLAAGMDNPAAGLKRGEFVVSVRQCAEWFNWSHGMAQRFLDLLVENSMIMRVVREPVHPVIQEAGHFIVCNYETYNSPRDVERYAERYTERNTEAPEGQEAVHLIAGNYGSYGLLRYTKRDIEPQGVGINTNINTNTNNKDTPAFAKAPADKPALVAKASAGKPVLVAESSAAKLTLAGLRFGEGVPTGLNFNGGGLARRSFSEGGKILLEIYQQHNQVLSGVRALTAERLRKCRSRIDQAVRDGCLEQYLADFAEAVKKAQSTPFLRGEGARGWRASFDWFVTNHRNVYAVLEGKYDVPAWSPKHREGASHGNDYGHIDGDGSRQPGVARRTSRGDPIYIPRQ
jgi:hypothetical protein